MSCNRASAYVRPKAGVTAVRLEIRAGSVAAGRALDPDKQAIADEAYRLEIGDSRIAITANAASGLFYAVETLVQLPALATDGCTCLSAASRTGRTFT